MYTVQRLSGRIQDFLADFVRGKNVLDAGCVDHTATLGATDTWLHKHLVPSADSVVGLGYGLLASSLLIIARNSASFPNVPTMQAEMSA